MRKAENTMIDNFRHLLDGEIAIVFDPLAHHGVDPVQIELHYVFFILLRVMETSQDGIKNMLVQLAVNTTKARTFPWGKIAEKIRRFSLI